jgi:hypothetical protein
MKISKVVTNRETGQAMKATVKTALAALAWALGASTALGQTPLWSDNFDDNRLSGWNTQMGEQITEANQQLAIAGDLGAYNPNDPLPTHLAALHSIPSSGPLPDGQTLELRVDWVGPHQDDAWAGIHAIWLAAPAHGYAFFLDENEAALVKCWNNITSFAVFFYEKPSLARENLTLVLALTRDGSDLQITTRVLDKDNGNAVLFERTVIDTPASDPVLPNGAMRGSRCEPDPSGAAWPITQAPTEVDLTLQWVGSEPASAQVIYDNVGVWRYESPALAIQNAVVLSWPATAEKFVLESSPEISGPWAAVLNPWCRASGDCIQAAISAPDARQFYRLRFAP